jgi:aminoacylase
MQYLAALRYFVKNGIKFNRTIYVTFVCEEEVGGDGGMKDFVHTDFFNKMNVGFALDESAPFEKDPRIFFAWHAERVKWGNILNCCLQTSN